MIWSLGEIYQMIKVDEDLYYFLKDI